MHPCPFFPAVLGVLGPMDDRQLGGIPIPHSGIIAVDEDQVGLAASPRADPFRHMGFGISVSWGNFGSEFRLPNSNHVKTHEDMEQGGGT